MSSIFHQNQRLNLKSRQMRKTEPWRIPFELHFKPELAANSPQITKVIEALLNFCFEPVVKAIKCIFQKFEI